VGVERGKAAEQIEHALAHGERAAAEERDGAPDAALRGPCGFADFRVIPGTIERRCGGARDVFLVEWVQYEPAAPRADGREQPSGRVTRDQKQRPYWRLFQHLEERVRS